MGTRLVELDAQFVSSLGPGDRVLGIAATGAVRRIPRDVAEMVETSVGAASKAFSAMGRVSVVAIGAFFDAAAARLENDELFAPIARANEGDVLRARDRGRSTTRLELTPKMRSDMVAALRMWRDLDVPETPEEIVVHNGWLVEQWRAPLGVVGFVFEGRPNVFADATGVLRGRNTVVFRIGSDALDTARAMMRHVIAPALVESGLPEGAVQLVESPEHAAGWSLFSDSRLALAVARGSGAAVAELGSIAQQAGIPVSLHGTGGAWMLVAPDADPERLALVIEHSLDRKVCNTVNVVCLPRTHARQWGPIVRAAADKAALARGADGARFHAVGDAIDHLGSAAPIAVGRAGGVVQEPAVSPMRAEDLSVEHEWEDTPELAVVLVDSLEEAVDLFNLHSPHFIASVLTGSEGVFERTWADLDAPFVGDGFTRWVDGQFALLRPELGLSNWQSGRLFSRGGILSGDSAFTVRLRVRQSDANLHR